MVFTTLPENFHLHCKHCKSHFTFELIDPRIVRQNCECPHCQRVMSVDFAAQRLLGGRDFKPDSLRRKIQIPLLIFVVLAICGYRFFETSQTSYSQRPRTEDRTTDGQFSPTKTFTPIVAVIVLTVLWHIWKRRCEHCHSFTLQTTRLMDDGQRFISELTCTRCGHECVRIQRKPKD